MSHRPSFEIAIAGAGLIGLTLALELHSRGLSVAVIDAAQPMRGASVAAAGMLAANDPHNPAVLGPFARHSLSLYPAFLDRLSSLSGLPVPFQTELTIQFLSDGTSTLLPERSVDPRQLAAAVLASARAVGITILENTGYPTLIELPDHVRILPQHGPELSAAQLVHASGAWFSGTPAIRPRKGQMLRVALPPVLPLPQVHRSAALYVVPRTQGPQAGSAVIGATDEDAGFDLSTSQHDLDRLRSLAAELVPALASTTLCPQLEAWAGLRPSTADQLPVLGRLPGTDRQWIASGHYRNGILLAPATAAALADALQSRTFPVNLTPFRPDRFA